MYVMFLTQFSASDVMFCINLSCLPSMKVYQRILHSTSIYISRIIIRKIQTPNTCMNMTVVFLHKGLVGTLLFSEVKVDDEIVKVCQ